MGRVTEKEVAAKLRDVFKRHRFIVNNLYFFKWESDVLTITRSRLMYEFEIKLSRSDFKADFSKEHRHKALTSSFRGYKPNRFYFVYPEGLVEDHEVPEQYGIYTFKITKEGRVYAVKRRRLGRLLTDKKFDRWERFAQKVYYKYLNSLP